MDDLATIVDDDMKTSVVQEKCEPCAARVFSLTALMFADDFSVTNKNLDSQGINPEPFTNDGRVDLDLAVIEFDFCHVSQLAFAERRIHTEWHGRGHYINVQR